MPPNTLCLNKYCGTEFMTQRYHRFFPQPKNKKKYGTETLTEAEN